MSLQLSGESLCLSKNSSYFPESLSVQIVKAHAIPCPHQPPTRSDNTVSVAQGSTATSGASKQLLPPDKVFKKKSHCKNQQLRQAIHRGNRGYNKTTNI